MTPSDLKSARARLGLSQEGLARRLGVSVRTVAGWEAGDRNGRPAPVPQTVELAIEGLSKQEERK